MPAKERPTSFLFYPADFLADPVVGAMSLEQVGAYVLLLCYAWPSKGVLPNDPAALARWSRLGDRWPEHAPAILAAFDVRPTVIVQKRMAQEWAATLRRLEQARERGALGASVRWGSANPASASEPPATAKVGEALPGLWTKHASNSHSEASPASAGEAQGDARTLVEGLAAGLALPKPAGKPAPLPPTDAAWQWLKDHATPERAAAEMRFVGWLIRTGTRDGSIVLALVKHKLVHNPKNPHAYYTPQGTARQSIAMRVAGDAAIAEHERLKREERQFLERGKR